MLALTELANVIMVAEIVVGSGVTNAALTFAEEDFLPAHFPRCRLGRIELAEYIELGRWRECELLLKLGHQVDLAKPIERI